MAAYRLLNSDFQSSMDRRILEEFGRFKGLAGKAFDAAFFAAKAGNVKERSAAQEKELCSLVAIQKDCVDDLTECGKLYFPGIYARFYAHSVTSRTPLGADLLLLQQSVANFMSIARERCFAHCCSGLKHCTTSAMAEMKFTHTVVEFGPEEGGDPKRSWKYTLYCRRDCFARACVNSLCMRTSPTNETRLAVEMFRLRGEQNPGKGYGERYSVVCRGDIIIENPLPIMNMPGLERHNSLCKQLGVSERDVAKCKAEIARKDAQKDSRREQLLQLEQKFHLDDVDAMFKMRSDLKFDSLFDAEQTFPHTIATIRMEISDMQLSLMKAHTHATDNPITNACLNQIAALVGPIRALDWRMNKDCMASSQAYDFMTGHTYHKIIPTMFGAGDFTSPTSPTEPTEFKCSINVICCALRIFDEYANRTLVALPVRDWQPEFIVFVEKASRKQVDGTINSVVNCWTSLIELVKRIGSQHIAELLKEDIATIDTRLSRKGSKATPSNVAWFVDTINRLNADSSTRALALGLVRIYPLNLCKEANEGMPPAVSIL